MSDSTWSESFGLAVSERDRLARHDARVALYSCAHDTRVEHGGGWYCFDCGSGFGIPGATS
ncbi:hypothetical protein [Microbacterium sp.]|uniref:hypothetical protein n=1 Tax=Microbacterium sp. TaxID=51671 RepID=UPI0039E49969